MQPYTQFVAQHPVYFIYGQKLAYPFLSRIAGEGAVIESFRIDKVTGYFLAKVRTLNPPHPFVQSLSSKTVP
jgi:hypothetical protein